MSILDNGGTPRAEWRARVCRQVHSLSLPRPPRRPRVDSTAQAFFSEKLY